MRNIVLSTWFRNPRIVHVALPLLYPGIQTSRAASLNRAIGQGIRRSEGVGFRGKDRNGVENARNGTRDSPARRTSHASSPGGSKSPLPRKSSGFQLSDARGNSESRPSTPRGGRFGQDIRHSRKDNEGAESIRMGKRIIKGEPDKFNASNRDFDRSSDRRGGGSTGATSRNSKPHWEPRGSQRPYESRSQGTCAAKTTYPSLAGAKSAYQPRSRGSDTDKSKLGRSFTRDNTRERGTDPRDQNASTKEHEKPSTSTRFTKSIDKRIPLSIPYTTPASEFLYGTSVVEAALKSKRDPRRKHYKLYIYTGENRENVDRDAELERLARRSGVEVARVGSEWLPLLDKMSASRPHNGYILEASPLPRLPVTSLRGPVEQDGASGFEVVLDYQSREDAAINGTSNFLKSSKNPTGRQPLVLFLDSILDPGNLGGIIRTASFLGVTAIGISKNCTAFSPVVLKASAGASENIPLFTVNKPAGFIADSKLAGWKIFAAVAPTGSHLPSVSTDNLANPLSNDPCILMIGSEGEGLRMNLRTKADIQLSIRGSGRSHGVDSLNVSVATGILVDAFLRKSSTTRVGSQASQDGEIPETNEDLKPVRDLF